MRTLQWLPARMLPKKPRGVRILHANGRVTRCRLARAETLPDGERLWIAYPKEGVMFNVSAGDRAAIAYLPPNNRIRFRMQLHMTQRRNENWPT